MIRNRTAEALDGWIAAEARGGRQWTCGDRTIAGYPFRIEIICNSLDLKRGAITASFGRTEAVAQVYQPRRIITEVAGPLRVSDGRVTVEGSWDLLQASINASPTGGLQRLSLAADGPKVTITGLGTGEIAGSGKHLELHVRPNPSRTAEQACDVAASVTAGPHSAPRRADRRRGADQSQCGHHRHAGRGLQGRPIVEELERWRKAGGKLDILMLAAGQGPAPDRGQGRPAPRRAAPAGRPAHPGGRRPRRASRQPHRRPRRRQSSGDLLGQGPRVRRGPAQRQAAARHPAAPAARERPARHGTFRDPQREAAAVVLRAMVTDRHAWRRIRTALSLVPRRRPKSGSGVSWPDEMMPRRMARVRVKRSKSLSPSPQRMARASSAMSSLRRPSISSTASWLCRKTSRHMVGSEAAMRVKSRKPPAENLITSRLRDGLEIRRRADDVVGDQVRHVAGDGEHEVVVLRAS